MHKVQRHQYWMSIHALKGLFFMTVEIWENYDCYAIWADFPFNILHNCTGHLLQMSHGYSLAHPEQESTANLSEPLKEKKKSHSNVTKLWLI